MDLDGNILNSGDGISLHTCGTVVTSSFNTWSNPERVSVEEVGDTIEMIFIETSMITFAVYPSRPSDRRVYKIIYSCKDGKWNKSERIYGEIIPAQKEDYVFE